MPPWFSSQLTTYSQKNAALLIVLFELAQPWRTCGGDWVASATGVAFTRSAAAWLSLPTLTRFWRTSSRRPFAAARLTNGSYADGARSRPTSSADSASVSLDAGLLKYVSAAVWIP